MMNHRIVQHICLEGLTARSSDIEMGPSELNVSSSRVGFSKTPTVNLEYHLVMTNIAMV